MDSNKTNVISTTPFNNIEELDILDDSTYIWVPFVVLLVILALSALVYLMARNRRGIKHIYCKRKLTRRYYIDDNFDADLERSLLSDTALGEERAEESLLNAQLQIKNQHYETFDTTGVSIAGKIDNGHGNIII